MQRILASIGVRDNGDRIVLEKDNDASCCEVHEGWLAILRKSMEDKISSALYVEDTLNLLKTHKTRLKVARLGEQLSNSTLSISGDVLKIPFS